MSNKILVGNFNTDPEALKHRSWIIGHFMEPKSPFCNQDFEIKWGKHKKGERRDTVSRDSKVDSLAILVYGKELFKFPSLGKEVLMEKEGDYLFFGKGTGHIWEMLEDTLIITIRWPSIPPEKDDKIV